MTTATPVQVLHDADSGTPFTSDPGGTTYIEEGSDPMSVYSLTGGASNDTVMFNQGNTIYNGGTGTNSADFSMSDSGVTVDMLHNHATNASGDMNAFMFNMQNVTGSTHDDTITLGNGAFDATGGLGADTITAGNGHANTFHYNSYLDSTAASHDTINNWHDPVGGAGGDNIDLTGADKAAGVTGTWNSTNFANQAQIDAQAVGTIGEYHANGNTFVVDHLSATHDAVIEIAGNHTLDAGHVFG
jgi:hypothetical protein